MATIRPIMSPIDSVRQSSFHLIEPSSYPMMHGEIHHHQPTEMNRELMGKEVGESHLHEWCLHHQNEQQHQQSIATTIPTITTTGGLGGLSRTKSAFALPSTDAISLLSSVSGSSSGSLTVDETDTEEGGPQQRFGKVMRDHVNTENGSVHFGKTSRKDMEKFLRKARSQREVAQSRNHTNPRVHASIAGSFGVPYTCLRQERPFLFDAHTYPLHEILAQTLNVPDLTLVHKVVPQEDLLLPLRNRQNRQVFQHAYDNFVTTFCIPLLHSMAIAKNLFHWAEPSDSITYRYQAFPTIGVARPGCPAQVPQCRMSQGHSIGCLFFHIPLTPSSGDSAIYVESYPGKEDWHPLQAKSVGLGFLYDGARCLQFGLENLSTNQSRVSLDFCVLLYREQKQAKNCNLNNSNSSLPHLLHNINHDPHGRGDDLSSPEMLNDKFASQGPGYYEEAVVHLGRACRPGMDVVSRKSKTLVDPDQRFGHPFC